MASFLIIHHEASPIQLLRTEKSRFLKYKNSAHDLQIFQSAKKKNVNEKDKHKLVGKKMGTKQ